MAKNRLWAWAFVALNVADGLTTWWVLSTVDGAVEGNPLVNLGWAPLIALKIAVVAFVFSIAKTEGRGAYWLVRGLVAYYVAVVGWNVNMASAENAFWVNTTDNKIYFGSGTSPTFSHKPFSSYSQNGLGINLQGSGAVSCMGNSWIYQTTDFGASWQYTGYGCNASTVIRSWQGRLTNGDNNPSSWEDIRTGVFLQRSYTWEPRLAVGKTSHSLKNTYVGTSYSTNTGASYSTFAGGYSDSYKYAIDDDGDVWRAGSSTVEKWDGVSWYDWSAGLTGGATDIAVSGNGNTIFVCQNLDWLRLSRDGGGTWQSVGDIKTWRSCGISQDGTVLIAGESTGRVYYSTDSGQTWNWSNIGTDIRRVDVRGFGTSPGTGGGGVSPVTASGTYSFGGSGSLTGSGSVTLTFGVIPEVGTGADCSAMFGIGGEFAYTGANSEFSVSNVIFSNAEAVLGEPWSCELLTESANPCLTAYSGATFVVEGIGNSMEYVLQQFIGPLADTFDYIGVPEPGSHCFLGIPLEISGKSDTAPEGKTGYDYLILLISGAWLLYSVIGRR